MMVTLLDGVHGGVQAADSLNASVAGGVLLYDIALRLQEEEEKRCSN